MLEEKYVHINDNCVVTGQRNQTHFTVFSVIKYNRTKHDLVVNAFLNNLEYVPQLITKFKIHLRGLFTIYRSDFIQIKFHFSWDVMASPDRDCHTCMGITGCDHGVDIRKGVHMERALHNLSRSFCLDPY